MRIRFTFFSIVFSLLADISSAQETMQKFLGIETGIIAIAGRMSDMDFIRGDVSAYSSSYEPTYLKSMMNKSYAGIHSEFISLNDKIGVSGGLHYSVIKSAIGKNNNWSDGIEFFYLLYHQEGVNTEYLKVKELGQSSSYLGVPLDIRFYPYKEGVLRIYFKVGTELAFMLQSQTEVLFYDTTMNPFQDAVAELISQPEPFIASVYGAAGIRIGNNSQPSVSMEVSLPSVFLNSGTSGLVDPIYGIGLQIGIHIPLKSKVK